MAILSKLEDLSAGLEGAAQGLAGQLSSWTGMSDSSAQLSLKVAGAGMAGLLLWQLLSGPKYKLPPGPRALPVMGNLHNLGGDKNFALIIDDMVKKYGDIMKLQLGPMNTVVLSSAELVREAFMRQGQNTSGRPYFYFMDIFSEGGQDIFDADLTPRVVMQRKLGHAALRKFATGKALEKYLESAIQIMERKLETSPEFNGMDLGYLLSYNILASMCFGKQFTEDDPFFTKMVSLTKQLEEEFTGIALADFFPIFKYIPTRQGRMMKATMNTFNSYLQEAFDEHLQSYDPDNLSDFTYNLINAMKEAEKDQVEQKNLKLLSTRNFVLILSDLFFAGTDTTRMTLNWIWHYLAAYPEVQRRAQEEVDAALGPDGHVTSKCREEMPYLDAVIHEVMRIRPVAASGIFHVATADIKLGEYDIPKGTSLMSNTWSIHMDSRNWQDPELFQPDRWLNENGQYVFQQSGFLPFSIGRRSCIGEAFAKLELHMLTAHMLKRYWFEPQPGEVIDLDVISGMVIKPRDQLIVAQRRK